MSELACFYGVSDGRTIAIQERRKHGQVLLANPILPAIQALARRAPKGAHCYRCRNGTHSNPEAIMVHVDVTLVDVCLSYYLTDHHNRRGELLLGISVDNTTTLGEVKEQLNSELQAADYGLPSWFSYNKFGQAVAALFTSKDDSEIFDASLDPPCDDDISGSCQAWFVVTYSPEMTMTPNQERAMEKALREHISVPAHVDACASALRYDLLNGPSWSLIPAGNIELFTADHFYTLRDDAIDHSKPCDKIVETYTSEVFDCYRDFIEELSTLYYDADRECVMDREPEGEEVETDDLDEETGEPIVEYYEPGEYYKLERRDIIEALFGRTLAQEIR